MISQPFIFTDHANDRFKERFSNLKKTFEVKIYHIVTKNKLHELRL